MFHDNKELANILIHSVLMLHIAYEPNCITTRSPCKRSIGATTARAFFITHSVRATTSTQLEGPATSYQIALKCPVAAFPMMLQRGACPRADQELDLNILLLSLFAKLP